MRRIWAIAIILFGFFSLTPSAHAEKRVALVIGNDRYANLPVLQKAANDAEAVGNTLAKLGFEVIRGRDLTRQGMIDKLVEFTARLEAGDTAVFFYAGHGVAIENVNYLVPTDVPAASAGAEGRVRGASIAEGDIIAEIQRRGARVAVMVLDACRNNPFPRVAGRSIGNTRGLADARPASGVFTIYSAGIGQEALDRLEPNDANPNSVFTRVFVEQLARPGLHIGELAVEVREKVAEIALRARNNKGEVDPHVQTPAYYDQTIGGRVFLAGRAIAVAPSMPSLPPAAPPSEAAQAWAIIKDTTSVAVLDAFIRRFDGTVYADFARARLEELKKSQQVVVAPPVAPQPPAQARPQPSPQGNMFEWCKANTVACMQKEPGWFRAVRQWCFSNLGECRTESPVVHEASCRELPPGSDASRYGCNPQSPVAATATETTPPRANIFEWCKANIDTCQRREPAWFVAVKQWCQNNAGACR